MNPVDVTISSFTYFILPNINVFIDIRSNDLKLGAASKVRNKVIEIGIRVLKQIHLNMYYDSD